ncbi:DUF1971 domain-containing protein [Parasphingopyxis lamellibrachiae]|uniref:Tellurite resistance-related uncharacterized protein n=1 Tax=Parasphingopyxis lamellibrachiae TaxID=680125 RepID=A0A3D9FEL2_9SPHN|nr:DUF1971 domain-containing protein [Parasphingopyxis lamellibrachiae]RED16002.1 tellurite resistance-related uncharacterized protein [Parasphingopyxis lamellibrachiae]
MPAKPYRSTPIFDENSLPSALRRDHSLKAGAWGRLNVLSGALRYTVSETGEALVLEAGHSTTILPEQLHFVEPLGPVEMRVDFYDEPPDMLEEISGDRP